MNSKRSVGEEGNKEHGFGNRREEHPCYMVAEILLELPAVLWKGQNFASMEIGHFIEMSQQSFEGSTWFLFGASSKMQEKDKLR